MRNKFKAAQQTIKFRELLTEVRGVLIPEQVTLSTIKNSLKGPRTDIDLSRDWKSQTSKNPPDGRYLSKLIKMDEITWLKEYDISLLWERLVTMYTCVTLDTNATSPSLSRSIYEDNKIIFSLVQEELEHNELNKELFEIYSTELTEDTLRHLTATVSLSIIELVSPKLEGTYYHLRSSVFEVLSMPYETIIAQGGYDNVELCTLIVALENQKKLDKILLDGGISH